MTVTRFCERLQIPRGTWYRWRSVSSSTKGPWPTPVQDAVEIDAKDKAVTFDAWGHRKLAELLRIDDGHKMSDATVYRVLARNGLCQPPNYTSEVRHLAGIHKETFIDPPRRRTAMIPVESSRLPQLALCSPRLC